MLLDLEKQLRAWADTISLVSTATGPIEPGQQVDFQILASAREMVAIDNVTGIPIGVATGQLLSSLPVRLKVAWKVKDEKDQDLTPQKDFLITNSAHSAESGEGQLISMIFLPPIVDLGVLRDAPPVPVKITVEASVTLEVVRAEALSTGGAEVVSVTIPNAGTQRPNPMHLKLPLELVPLEVPTFLGLFRHKTYRPFERDMEPGFALLIVPSSSPLRALTEVDEVLRRLDEAVRPLRALAQMATFITRLGIVRQALGAQPMVRVVDGNVSDLTSIHMRTETLLGFDIFNRDMRANDRVSAMIFMGPPDRRVGCYNDQEFATGEGAFEIRVTLAMITLIPVVREIAPGAADVIKVIEHDSDDNGFEDSLSSVQFLSDYDPMQP